MVVDNIDLNQNLTSCDYLVRACVDTTLSTTSQIITLNFNLGIQHLYIAEISFYSDMNRQCSPVGPLTISVTTTTTSVTTSGNFQWLCCIMYMWIFIFLSRLFRVCSYIT